MDSPRREIHYHTLFEQASDAIFVVDEDGHFLDVNSAACRLTGYEREELLRMRDAELIVPGQHARIPTEHARVKEDSAVHSEWRVRRKDGSEFVGDATARRLANGCVQSFFRDISERKRTEDALRESEQRLRLALDAARMDTFDWDLVTGVLTWGRHAELWGLEPGERTETYATFTRRIHPDDLPGVDAELARCMARQEPFVREYRVVWPDGSVHWMASRGEFVFDEQRRAIRMRGTVQEVSAQKRAEQTLREKEQQLQQAQKMEALGRLSGGVAHDFNNLLSVILGYSDLLRARRPSDMVTRKSLDAIQDAGQRAAALTQQLLAFSRRTMLELQVLDLNRVVSDAVSMLRRLIGEHIRVTTTLAAARSHVRADSSQLGQVLMNLAVNARQAMPRGGELTFMTANARVDATSASAHPDIPHGEYAVLSVLDTGIGMAPELRSRIFEPFFSTKRLGEGTGLGLSVVLGIVAQSGGYMNVRSEPGKGSSFNVYLPVVEEPVAAGSRVDAAAGEGGREVILVVEDEDALRGMVASILSPLGYRVLVASEGGEALRLLQQHEGKVDLVLTDVVMPGVGGRELVERIEARYPDIKVIYTSGYTDDDVLRRGITQREVAYLPKPYNRLELLRLVRQTLDEA